MHLGGKLEVDAEGAAAHTATTSPAPTRLASPASARRSPRTPRTRAASPSSATPSPCVTDGSAVLGLGNIGPAAALPVMEGKAALFKRFADVDAWPVCLDTQDTDEIVEIARAMAPGVRRHQPRGHRRAALLRDRGRGCASCSTSRCSTTTSTAPRSSCSPRSPTRCAWSARTLADVRIVVSGAGAAGHGDHPAAARAGRAGRRRVRHPRRRAQRPRGPRPAQDLDRRAHERRRVRRDPRRGRSPAPTCSSASPRRTSSPATTVATMAERAIVLALANPDPEVDPIEAQRHAAVVATGRSDYPNQINNVLAFPGVFRGLLDAGAREITDEMLRRGRPRDRGRRQPRRAQPELHRAQRVRPGGRARRRGRRPRGRGAPRAGARPGLDELVTSRTRAGVAWPVDGLGAWVGEWCAARGLRVREAVPVRAMPWASVVCFELEGPAARRGVGQGDVAAAGDEVDLLPVLARALRASSSRRWPSTGSGATCCCPTAGPTVGDVPPDEALPAWRSALIAYARLQHAATAACPSCWRRARPTFGRPPRRTSSRRWPTAPTCTRSGSRTG